MAVRIQRKRTKGWRMPEGAVYVGRPSRWGNPFPIGMLVPEGDPIELQHRATRRDVVELFEDACAGLLIGGPLFSAEDLAELRGKDLACWCPLEDSRGRPVPCHADVLIELANAGGV